MRVGLGKFNASRCNSVDIRSVEVFRSITASVESALIIGVKNYDVGIGGLEIGCFGIGLKRYAAKQAQESDTD